MLGTDSGTRVMFALADRVLRPVSARAAARQLVAIVGEEDLSAFSLRDRALLRLAARASAVAPRQVVALVAAQIRHETSPFIAPLETRRFERRLRDLRGAQRRPNLNILGEAILGWEEAGRRVAAVEALLARDDVECVSVKVSAFAPGLSLLDFEGSLQRAAEPLRRLYRAAGHPLLAKLVNLDMEEHRDLDLTVDLFCRVLAEEEFSALRAGIALQAYLPDSHGALDRLLEFARHRRSGGSAPIRIRLVKGANLAMERVEAEVHGWVAPTYATKADTDAAYVNLLERLIEASSWGLIEVGVASHNVFDLSYALQRAEDYGITVELEMLAGMADGQADVIARHTGGVLVYLPTTTRTEFRNAMAYLARRLDENATPEGFLRHVLDLVPGGTVWDEQAARFRRSIAEAPTVVTTRRQRQDRRSPVAAAVAVDKREFFNEPDTDLTVPINRTWALGLLHAQMGAAPAPADIVAVDAAVARATEALRSWRIVDIPTRRKLLLSAAEEIAARRSEAISAMVQEAGKTFAEADPECSEAVDYARFYAHATRVLEELSTSLDSEPLGVVVVAPPWNFPFAIPAGSVLAALAAGNTVILKPSPEARRCASVLVEALHAGGFSPECVQLVAADDDDAGMRLITHPDIGGVVLTGSWDTARLFSRAAPGRRVLGETSGKNALVVSANADVDVAVRDVVRSAFGHAGQKCSAASLIIVEASLYDKSSFLRQLSDATQSLRVGPAEDAGTEVGPIVGPLTPALMRALEELDEGESWLVAPQRIEDRLWRPGVRLGVQPGSWAHRTEWFGPVLGVMRAASFEQAIAWQNDVPFGLTAGLHSLDPVEQRYWMEAVEAGNLYINRHTTGAIVGRQPFGGWKRSSFGPTAKAGGPNYLLGLRRWRDARPVGVERAIGDYTRAMAETFAGSVELVGLSSESNEFRYRALSETVVVRVDEEVTHDEIAKALGAASLCGTAVDVSSPTPRGDLPGIAVTVESAAALAERLRNGDGLRLRLLGNGDELLLVAAAEGGVTFLDEPIASNGRLELVRWLREQTVNRSLHRYGNVVYERFAAADAVSRTSSRPRLHAKE